MNPLQTNQQATEADARNRAAAYTQQAQQEAGSKEQSFALQNSTDFQRMLWLKHLDQSYARDLQAQQHSHAMAFRDSEFRATMELETKRQQAAFELRKLELQGKKGISGDAMISTPVSQPSFWESKLFLAILSISLPLVLPPFIAALFNVPVPVRRDRLVNQKTARPKRRRRRNDADVCLINLNRERA